MVVGVDGLAYDTLGTLLARGCLDAECESINESHAARLALGQSYLEWCDDGSVAVLGGIDDVGHFYLDTVLGNRLALDVDGRG